MSCGSEEPNAIVRLNDKSNLTEPNVRATEIEIYEGLEAKVKIVGQVLILILEGLIIFFTFIPAGFLL